MVRCSETDQSLVILQNDIETLKQGVRRVEDKVGELQSVFLRVATGGGGAKGTTADIGPSAADFSLRGGRPGLAPFPVHVNMQWQQQQQRWQQRRLQVQQQMHLQHLQQLQQYQAGGVPSTYSDNQKVRIIAAVDTTTTAVVYRIYVRNLQVSPVVVMGYMYAEGLKSNW